MNLYILFCSDRTRELWEILRYFICDILCVSGAQASPRGVLRPTIGVNLTSGPAFLPVDTPLAPLPGGTLTARSLVPMLPACDFPNRPVPSGSAHLSSFIFFIILRTAKPSRRWYVHLRLPPTDADPASCFTPNQLADLNRIRLPELMSELLLFIRNYPSDTTRTLKCAVVSMAVTYAQFTGYIWSLYTSKCTNDYKKNFFIRLIMSVHTQG